LADEPTGNLDNETAKQITKLLFDSVRKLKTTMVLVTHDRELAELADRIVTLKDGRCDF
jgi:predicted ABC-type transport system involved in lysophospholipase L1 biosynthesis ATPase subunit